METKACFGCARSRRKCCKRTPRCLRCRTRGISCDYPSTKPSSFVALINPHPQAVETTLLDFALLDNISPVSFIGPPLETWWFASPPTWIIERAPDRLTSNVARFSDSDLDRILKGVFHWLADWVTQGENPFIHRQLYRHRLPGCIQDAYLALSAYLQKTASNEKIIYKVIEEKLTQLIERGVPLPDSTCTATSSSLDTVEFLARVQALLVYQCIGLYDGNIRLRHLAEQHIPLLESWLVQLLEHISQAACCGATLLSPPYDQTQSLISTTTCDSFENLVWYSWIVIESCRRTWLIAAGVQGIFKLLQKNTASCMGGMNFTSRQGFWEAPTAAAWERRCVEVYAGLVQLTEVEKLLAMVPRSEINEFAKLVFQCTYGVEQTERWGV